MEDTLRKTFESAGLAVRLVEPTKIAKGWSVWLQDNTEAQLPGDDASDPAKVQALIAFLKEHPKEVKPEAVNAFTL